MRHARLQRPELDEARRGVLGEQAAGLRERRELRVVDRVRALARDDADVALEQLQPDRARDPRVDVLDVGLEVVAQRLPPEAGVDEVGPLLVEPGLELVLVDRAGQALELLVRLEQDRRRRHLVDVAHLQADDPVLDVVDDPDAVAHADLGGPLDQVDEPEPLAVERDRHARLERDLDRLRLVGRELGPGDELEDVVVGRVREVLDPAALGGAAPEVVVDRVRRALRAALDRDPVLARVGDLLVAAHRPRAHGRDHLQLRRERGDRALDAHLVVALAGAAVRDRVAAGSARVLDRELGDQRAPERGEQRVAVAVVGVRLDRRQHVVARELLARVDDVAVERAELHRLALDDLVVLARLAEVDRERDDLGLVLVLDPLEHHARVEAAAVEQQHAADLAVLGEVAGDAGGVGVGDAVDFGVGGGIAGLVAHGRDSLERSRLPAVVRA